MTACPRCHQPAYREDSEVRRDTNGAKARLICPEGHSWYVTLGTVDVAPEPRRTPGTQGRGPVCLRGCARCETAYETEKAFSRYCAPCRVEVKAERDEAMHAAAKAARARAQRPCRLCGQPFAPPFVFHYCPACRALPYCPRCQTRHRSGTCPQRLTPQGRRAARQRFTAMATR